MLDALITQSPEIRQTFNLVSGNSPQYMESLCLEVQSRVTCTFLNISSSRLRHSALGYSLTGMDRYVDGMNLCLRFLIGRQATPSPHISNSQTLATMSSSSFININQLQIRIVKIVLFSSKKLVFISFDCFVILVFLSIVNFYQNFNLFLLFGCI